VLDSDLAQGSGLASSAALELASALALSGGEELSVDRMTLARIAQRAENEYVGVSCGLMDQFASAFGVNGAALLLDCRSLEHREVALSLDDVALVVAESGSTRRLESSAYNERRWQCETVAAMLGADSLRDVTLEMLNAAGDLDPVLERRTRHVVSENDRVIAAVAALEIGDFATAGHLFNESHASLRDLFEVSSPELDALVEIATAVPGVLGSRLTGAGFGGCTITLVRREAISALTQAIEEHYPERSGLQPDVFEVRPSRGAEIVSARS
jgi:galactokinase